jgi:hypothetical protein
LKDWATFADAWHGYAASDGQGAQELPWMNNFHSLQPPNPIHSPASGLVDLDEAQREQFLNRLAPPATNPGRRDSVGLSCLKAATPSPPSLTATFPADQHMAKHAGLP